MSKRNKDILELVECSADAALESVSKNKPVSTVGVLSFAALGMEVGGEAAERMVLREITERLTGEAP